MRIKINLHAENDVSIPIEYNYSVYLNLRKTLMDYLGGRKPKLFYKYKKNFPDFTFSQLMIPERRIETGFIHVLGNFLSIFVSADDDSFMEYLVKAVNDKRELSIHGHRFPLKKVEIPDEPEYQPEMKFRMLSPLLLVTIENKKPRFLRPADPDLNQVFASNLVETYNTLHPPTPKNNRPLFKETDIKIILDQDYMERKRVLTKLITVRGINYKTILSPIVLQGDPELIRFGYRRGLGFKPNFGFGMIEAIE